MLTCGRARSAGAQLYAWEKGSLVLTTQTLKPGEEVNLGQNHVDAAGNTFYEIIDFDPEYWVAESDLEAA